MLCASQATAAAACLCRSRSEHTGSDASVEMEILTGEGCAQDCDDAGQERQCRRQEITALRISSDRFLTGVCLRLCSLLFRRASLASSSTQPHPHLHRRTPGAAAVALRGAGGVQPAWGVWRQPLAVRRCRKKQCVGNAQDCR